MERRLMPFSILGFIDMVLSAVFLFTFSTRAIASYSVAPVANMVCRDQTASVRVSQTLRHDIRLHELHAIIS